MPTPTYTKSGSKAQTAVKLNPSIFGIKDINHELLKQAYVSYLSNGRINHAVTKTRGEIRGGGRKPWQQKGTGRARVGSRRTPLWRGGGIIFGPTGNENYSKKLNQNAKRSAIRQALSLASNAGKIRVVEELAIKSPRTREIVALTAKIGAEGYSLLVVDNLTDEMKKATANLPNVKAVQAKYLNVARLLDADSVVITKPALEAIDKWLTSPASVGSKS